MTKSDENRLFYSLNDYLRDKYGCKVRKISVDAGFTCPNRDGMKGEGGCAYCNVDSFAISSENSITCQVTERAEKLRAQGVNSFILYFQSYSNTYADMETIRRRMDLALVDKGIVSVYIGTRPDVIDAEKLQYYSKLNEKYEIMLEYGLQSANDNTLKIINRGHTAAEFADAVRLTHEYGIKTCAHIIFGLPGDTREDMMRSVELCVELGMHSIKFHHLHVVKNTPLADWYYKGTVDLLTQQEYIEILAEGIGRMKPDMVVARLVGDAAGNTLIAPMWPQNKAEFTQELMKYMTENGIYQGCRLDHPL
ncbi:TIGR01212 family radical SAM protein [Seleniivibrio sp.]|uniref:TIGR01212 family radical SAM protein n=1 Tax=Seleniivibrio sp. TaxID=2898801 RepID=UPI0025FC5F59|nr:TIGR01212 family radical SAM protein [Seleniivibrio sp.]MCD8554666.1 TIGR01212 family radical SAM protein [Seleniivibrio sp.]